MHTYYDESKWPYFNDVDDAAHEIGLFCRRWGRIQVRQTKEKFGTARVYCSFGLSGHWAIHGLIKPGWIYYQWPRWIYHIDCFLSNSWLTSFIDRVLVPYQCFIYRLAYKRAIRRYPHIREEILCCADYSSLLKGL